MSKIYEKQMTATHFFSRLPPPESRNPFANGLLSIFSCVICQHTRHSHYSSKTNAHVSIAYRGSIYLYKAAHCL